VADAATENMPINDIDVMSAGAALIITFALARRRARNRSKDRIDRGCCV